MVSIPSTLTGRQADVLPATNIRTGNFLSPIACHSSLPTTANTSRRDRNWLSCVCEYVRVCVSACAIVICLVCVRTRVCDLFVFLCTCVCVHNHLMYMAICILYARACVLLLSVCPGVKCEAQPHARARHRQRSGRYEMTRTLVRGEMPDHQLPSGISNTRPSSRHPSIQDVLYH